MAFDGLIVEYDEEQHFNRYRAAALTPDLELPIALARRLSGVLGNIRGRVPSKSVQREILDKRPVPADVRSCRSSGSARRSWLPTLEAARVLRRDPRCDSAERRGPDGKTVDV